MKCEYCGIAARDGLCMSCEIIPRVNTRNAVNVLKRALEVLQITGPTADMFIRRASREADRAREGK